MKIKAIIILSIFTLLFAMGCSNRKNLSPFPSQDPEAKDVIADSVNCRTAKQDIALLREEEVSTGKQVLAGVRSVVPFSAAAGILMGDYRDRVQVATGKYNKDLKAKIAQIQRTCGVR